MLIRRRIWRFWSFILCERSSPIFWRLRFRNQERAAKPIYDDKTISEQDMFFYWISTIVCVGFNLSARLHRDREVLSNIQLIKWINSSLIKRGFLWLSQTIQWMKLLRVAKSNQNKEITQAAPQRSVLYGRWLNDFRTASTTHISCYPRRLVQLPIDSERSSTNST